MGHGQRKSKRNRDYDLDELFHLDDFFERWDFDWSDWWQFRRRVIVDTSSKRDTGFPIGLGLAALLSYNNVRR